MSFFVTASTNNCSEEVTSACVCSSDDVVVDADACSKRRVSEERLATDDLKKSRVEGGQDPNADAVVLETETTKHADSDVVHAEAEQGNDQQSDVKEFLIGEKRTSPAFHCMSVSKNSDRFTGFLQKNCRVVICVRPKVTSCQRICSFSNVMVITSRTRKFIRDLH